MATIAEAAAQALAAKRAAELALAEQARTDLVAAVCAAVGAALAPLDATELNVAYVDLADGVVVLTDSTVSVSGTAGGAVYLVRDQDGWTRIGAPLHSLADLGAALAGDDT